MNRFSDFLELAVIQQAFAGVAGEMNAHRALINGLVDLRIAAGSVQARPLSAE